MKSFRNLSNTFQEQIYFSGVLSEQIALKFIVCALYGKMGSPMRHKAWNKTKNDEG